MKVCGSCRVTKPLEEFNKDSHTTTGYACYCKECNKERTKTQYRQLADNHEWKLKQALRASKNRAKARGLEHTLTLDDLKELYPEDGRCPVYEEIELKWGEPKWSSPSIDRIDSTKGYTYDNCQIISNKANKLKNDATLEDLERLVDFLKENGFGIIYKND